MNKYLPVIGLEIHVELKTRSKMFCQCEANYFGKPPNSQVCPVCLGMPGALPVPNKKAVEWTILIGKALNCQINKMSKFDRKHYFYPDLPKGYQISQYDEPLCINGEVDLVHPQGVQMNDRLQPGHPKGVRKFRIRRVHLEEDTGKLLHVGNGTLVDFNRSGVPLVEIVTEPDFNNSEDVKRFLEELQVVVRYLGVTDADMEKGSMRLEPNISVAVIPAKAGIQKKNWIPDPNFAYRLRWARQVGDDKTRTLPNYKVEVKNINSFRFVKQAIEYEIVRQTEILEKGETPIQETRGFDSNKQITYSQRTKEEAQDYRYFPEPDIPPMNFDEKYLQNIFNQLAELPAEKLEKYLRLGLKYQDAFTLSRDRRQAEKFESSILKIIKDDIVKPADIANVMINRKDSANLSADKLYDEVKRRKQPVVTDEKILDVLINRLIETNKKAVTDFKNGKENAVMFLVGQMMREIKGKADAIKVKERIIEKLNHK